MEPSVTSHQGVQDSYQRPWQQRFIAWMWSIINHWHRNFSFKLLKIKRELWGDVKIKITWSNCYIIFDAALKKEQRAGFSADLKLGNLLLEPIINLLYFCRRRKMFGYYNFQDIRPMHQRVPRELMLITYASGPYGVVAPHLQQTLNETDNSSRLCEQKYSIAEL